MPSKTSCFALTATAFLAKQMTMDKKGKTGGEKGQDSQVGTGK